MKAPAQLARAVEDRPVLLDRLGRAAGRLAVRIVLKAMGATAGRVLGVGKVQMTGTTSNQQHFDANPLRIWYVTTSQAVVEGEDLGPIGPLAEQAHMSDFYFPQRGMFAVGRVFISPLKPARRETDPITAST